MNAKSPTAVVAGVGPALGAALCRALANKGYHVVALSRSLIFTESLSQEPTGEGSISAMSCDFTDEQRVKDVFAEIETAFGGIDALVYNAHELLFGPFCELSSADFERVWKTNCAGAFLCSQQVIPNMQKNNRGNIIFTGATASIRAGNQFAAFASSKFALRGLAQSLAREFGPAGIHVAHVIIDGLIWGEPARELHKAQEDDCIKPESIAQAYLNLIEQEPSAWTHELDLRPSVESF